MKNALRIIALLLVVSMSVVLLASCNNDASESSATSTTEAKGVFDNLEQKDYQNAEVNILVYGEWADTYKSTEVTPKEGEPQLLNDAITARNEMVENFLNVKIGEVATAAIGEMNTKISADVMSGLGEYDIVMPYFPDAATLALDNNFYELNNLPNFDINHECWDQNCVESLSINNTNYFVTGDMSLLSLACTHAIVFNKDMISTYGLESPYDLVNDGAWTIDKLEEMAQKVTADIDGISGTMSYKDRYGFLINSNFVTSMFLGAGMSLTSKDSEDIPYISITGNATTSAYTKFKRIFDLVNNENATGKIDHGTYLSSATASGGSVWDAATQSVANKLALFRAMSIIDIIDLGAEECNFGIIPVPKFDSKQEKYYSNVSTILATCVAIPTSVKDEEMSAHVAQAMCQASTATIKDAYVENILKSRKIQDNESEEMLDIIFGSRVYDLSIVFNWGGSGVGDANSIGNFMNNIAMNGTDTYTSKLQSIEPVIENALSDTLEKFNALD